MALIGGLLFTTATMAQTGSFTITNTTTSTYDVKVGSSSDLSCTTLNSSGIYSCGPGTTVIPDLGFAGRWVAFKAKDGCGLNGVENTAVGCYGYGVSTSTFVDCNSNTVTLTYVDWFNGSIN